jgi:tight adherence protein C
MDPLLIVLLFFGAALTLIATVQTVALERHERNATLRRLKAIDIRPKDVRSLELSRPMTERVLAPLLRAAGKVARRFTPAGAIDRLSHDLEAAGSPAGWDGERILALKVLGSGAAVLFGLATVPVLGASAIKAIFWTAIMTIIAYYLPEWILRSRVERRQAAIRRALPDALDLLSITVEAGLGFDAAVSRVARQAGGPLGEELHRMLQEMQIGRPRADALRDLGDRSTLPELKSFVLAMVQADIFGISIGKVLHVQAAELRMRRRQTAEEKAQKIPVKITFPLIACIFPALFVVILGPAVLTVYHSIIA